MRVASIVYLYISLKPVFALNNDIMNYLKIFSIVVGLFETVIIYSQTKMMSKIQMSYYWFIYYPIFFLINLSHSGLWNNSAFNQLDQNGISIPPTVSIPTAR